ncbi:hypothetical protein H311_00664 [Anncaliia algerae PRA109]|nr:hypothetical protein H311_00664 [Anncaliia algerae PRA109]
MNKEYYPSLFNRKKKQLREEKEIKPVEETKKIKLVSLLDTAITPLKPIKHNYITIFGSTDTHILEEKVRSIGEIKEIEYGKNYLNVIYENEESNQKLLELNKTFLNGEMIGVFKQNNVVKQDEKYFYNRKGIFYRIFLYFLG